MVEDKVEKNSEKEKEKENRLKKNEEGLRELQDNMNLIIFMQQGYLKEKKSSKR